MGIPVAKVTFNLYENDKKLIEFGKNKTMEVMWAAGAQEVVQEARYAHLVGAARMGSDPETSVVDQIRPHSRYRQLVCLRRQHHANARIGQPWPDHHGHGSAHRRLSDPAGQLDLQFRRSQHGAAADSARLVAAGHLGPRNATDLRMHMPIN